MTYEKKKSQNFPPAGNGNVLNFCLNLNYNLLINQRLQHCRGVKF